MRHLLLVFLGSAALSLGAQAQSPAFSPLGLDQPVVIGTLSVGPEVIARTTKEVKIAWVIVAWRDASGGSSMPEYTVDIDEVSLSGDPAMIAELSAANVADFISARTPVAAAAEGYASCSASAPAGAGVTLQSCAIRTLTGFDGVESELSRRTYSYTCSSASLSSVSGSFNCAGGAEPTYEAPGGSLQ